jgi:hypothetical protein
MKPPLASVVLRKNAPRETVGQSFVHRNRYDKLRDSSPAPSLRTRTESNASQKRKVGDEDDLFSQNLVSAKVSRIENFEDEDVAKLESKMSKVSTMCGKLVTSVQQLDIEDPLRALIADLIETVRISNEVQEEMHQRYRKSQVQEASNVSMWVSSDFPPFAYIFWYGEK